MNDKLFYKKYNSLNIIYHSIFRIDKLIIIKNLSINNIPQSTQPVRKI